MKRIWFKKEMARKILTGKKTATTRYRTIGIGAVQAVSGSRFNANAFAILTIWQIHYDIKWIDVISSKFKQEGFDSPQAMPKR